MKRFLIKRYDAWPMGYFQLHRNDWGQKFIAFFNSKNLGNQLKFLYTARKELGKQ